MRSTPNCSCSFPHDFQEMRRSAAEMSRTRASSPRSSQADTMRMPHSMSFLQPAEARPVKLADPSDRSVLAMARRRVCWQVPGAVPVAVPVQSRTMSTVVLMAMQCAAMAAAAVPLAAGAGASAAAAAAGADGTATQQAAYLDAPPPAQAYHPPLAYVVPVGSNVTQKSVKTRAHTHTHKYGSCSCSPNETKSPSDQVNANCVCVCAIRGIVCRGCGLALAVARGVAPPGSDACHWRRQLAVTRGAAWQ